MATKTATITIPNTMPRTLEQCEAVIEAGLKGFVEAGRALAEIKANELYKDRAMASTWKKYCQERWSMTSAQADRLINASRVFAVIKDSQKVPIGTLPANESATRPLNQLPRGMIADAWKQATELAGGQPTANQVQQVVDRILNKQVEDRSARTKAQRIAREEKKDAIEKKDASVKSSASAPKEATPNMKAGKYKAYAMKAKADLESIIVDTGLAREGAAQEDKGWFDFIINYLRQLQGLMLQAGIPEDKPKTK